MEQKNELNSYIQNISLFLLGVLFMAFPVVFTTITTNPIVLPKQVLLGGIVTVLLILQVIKMFAEKSVKLRRTPFDIPVFLFAFFAFASSIFAVNKADALTAFVPYFFAILGFFLIVNIVKDKNSLLFLMSSLVILMGIIITIYALFKLDKPALLPIETAFQTAFSEISLDSGRIAQGFLLGSGFGTYAVDFSRWKQASFNQYSDLWNLTFFRSSNFALELLATTGVLGICAFIFLLIRVLNEIRVSPQNKMLVSIIALFLISLLLPFNFTSQTLLFTILGLFAANQGLINKAQNRFFDIELQIVTFRKGLIAMETPHAKNGKSLILPFTIGVIILIIVGIMGFYGTRYVASDLTFQKSLVSAAQNNGSLTYQQQAQAISTFQHRDGFYRVFSQTNLALANTLASQQPAGYAPNQAIQQNIVTLIQQSINAARAAVTVAPQTYLNWQNLSSIYRGLIGFGQNAESFAVATAQQAINLDPNNPQGYITLGGIYYQLGQWDNAQTQFQIAVSLKPDYANSYYNLGHALEQKKDFQNSLAQYQAVRSLVGNDKASLDQIDKEIAALQGKAQADTNPSTDPNQTLNVSKPEVQLPAQNPPVKIPAPPTATESSR